MYIIWKYHIHTKVGNLEWMLRQFNWSLHMSKQVWHVGAYQEKNSILYYLSKIKQFIWSDLDVRIMIGNYLAQLSSFLRVVWWVPALLEAIPGSRLVEAILLLSMMISIRWWGEKMLKSYLPCFFGTVNFGDSDVDNEACVRLLTLVAVAKPVRHVRLLLNDISSTWQKKEKSKKDKKGPPFPMGPQFLEECSRKCTHRSARRSCTPPLCTNNFSLVLILHL